MQPETLFESELWRDFDARARDKREDPVEVLAGLMKDYLEEEEDEEDVRQARSARAEAESGGVVSWDDLKKERADRRESYRSR